MTPRVNMLLYLIIHYTQASNDFQHYKPMNYSKLIFPGLRGEHYFISGYNKITSIIRHILFAHWIINLTIKINSKWLTSFFSPSDGERELSCGGGHGGGGTGQPETHERWSAGGDAVEHGLPHHGSEQQRHGRVRRGRQHWRSGSVSLQLELSLPSQTSSCNRTALRRGGKHLRFLLFHFSSCTWRWGNERTESGCSEKLLSVLHK